LKSIKQQVAGATMKKGKEAKKPRKWEAEKFVGVYERPSNKRRYEGKPDVCYWIFYRVDGKLKGEKVGWASEGYSQKLASIVRSERLRSIRHGEELPNEKPKAPYFKDTAKKYLKWATENKTRGGYDDKNRYENHLAGRFDDKRLNEISPLDLERMKSELTKEGKAPATVAHCLKLFRQIFNKAVSWGLHTGENPIKAVKMPMVRNQRERFLSHEEARLLLDELKKVSETTHDITLLSLYCGLRAGEIFNLKGNDIDFTNGIITIMDPKNNPTRKSYMNDTVREMLLRRKPEHPTLNIFTKKYHRKETEDKMDEVSQTFSKVADKLFNQGVEDRRQRLTFHSCRHTFASWLALNGESLLTIKELLGHKTLTMVQRYAHLTPDDKRRATLKLEETFIQKGKNNVGEMDPGQQMS
jgi:integrase